jgi:hypothetical protein
MIELPSCKITGVFGPVSSGKTYLIEKWAEEQNRIVVFDATGEFIDKPRYTQIVANPRKLWQLLKNQPYFFRVCYAPGRELETDFAWVLSALWHTQSDKLLIVDEFHEICPVSYKSDDVNTMLRFARHDKLGFIGVSQRIADVHKLFTSSCRTVVLFWTQEARDLEAISDRWGRVVSEQVASLRPLIHDDVTGITTQIPQCVVIQKGREARIFDFVKDDYICDNRETSAEENEEELEPVRDADTEETNMQNQDQSPTIPHSEHLASKE